MLDFKMMCVQPIRLNAEIYSKIISKQEYADIANSFINPDGFDIKWLDNFTNKYRKFRSFKPLSLPADLPHKQLLIDDLNENRFMVNGECNLSSFLNSEQSKVALLYDPRFFQFFIIYELQFALPEEKLISLLMGSTLNQQKDDLYNTLRRMLVKEESDSSLGKWGQGVHDSLTGLVTDLIQKVISENGVEQVAKIGKNTGNITFFFNAASHNMALKNALISCNSGAESIQRDVIPTLDDDNVFYAFYGRFHTIVAPDESYYYRYFPIQFHMQFIWFITGYYLEAMDRLNNEIISKKSNHFFQKNVDEVDAFVNKIQFLIMHNENFKLSIEMDNELVLSKIENRWNIEKSLANAAQYIAMFKDYMDRLYTKRQAAAASRQNSILFIISCLQIIALLSVWADFLSITDPVGIPNVGPVNKAFGNTSNLLSFNLWLPTVLGLTIIVLSVVGFFKRK
jgi:hypothetical protein